MQTGVMGVTGGGGGGGGVTSLTGTTNQIFASAATGPVTLFYSQQPDLARRDHGQFSWCTGGECGQCDRRSTTTQDPVDFSAKNVTRPFSEVVDSAALPRPVRPIETGSV